MEIKPKMEKKTKLSFIYSFMPPKKMKGVELQQQKKQVQEKQEEKQLQLFFYFMVLEEMNEV